MLGLVLVDTIRWYSRDQNNNEAVNKNVRNKVRFQVAITPHYIHMRVLILYKQLIIMDD